MRAETDCALVLNLSLWVLQCSQNVRGYVDWYMDLVSAPHLIECLVDCITESMLGTLEMVTDATGDLDVRLEVKNKIETLAAGGGYILNPVHNVQPDVPVQNLLAMIDAALQYGWFPTEKDPRMNTTERV
jgi:uroporphyrinogen-III decarboxylase